MVWIVSVETWHRRCVWKCEDLSHVRTIKFSIKSFYSLNPRLGFKTESWLHQLIHPIFSQVALIREIDNELLLILSDCNWTRTQNHLVRKRTLNHFARLAKELSYLSIRCIWLYIFVMSRKKMTKNTTLKNDENS